MLWILLDENWKKGPIKIDEWNDAENSEENCAKAKFGCKTELIDVKERSVLKKITTAMIKCAHRYDLCGERDALMNKDVTNQECIRCNKTE